MNQIFMTNVLHWKQVYSFLLETEFRSVWHSTHHFPISSVRVECAFLLYLLANDLCIVSVE